MLTLYCNPKETKQVTAKPFLAIIPDTLTVRVIGDGQYSIDGNHVSLIAADHPGTTDFEFRAKGDAGAGVQESLTEHVTLVVNDPKAPPVPPQLVPPMTITPPGLLGLVEGDGKDLEKPVPPKTAADKPRPLTPPVFDTAPSRLTAEQEAIENRQAARNVSKPKTAPKPVTPTPVPTP